MRTVPGEGVWARWGLLASAFALGAALILASWSNYRSARDATTALYVGQGRILEREFFGLLRRGAEARDVATVQALLDSMLVAQADQGLRHVAVLDEQDRPIASAGESILSGRGGPQEEPLEVGGDRGPTFTRAGARIRMAVRRPRFVPPGAPEGGKPAAEGEQPGAPEAPPAGEPWSPGASSRQGDPRGGDPQRAGRHHGFVLEFEPLVASHLMDRAGQLLAFGLAAALVMMFVAGVSWGISRRYERAKRHLERERRLSLLGEMSAVLAHEIRNPLASLKGHAQLLAERLAPEGSERRKANRVVLEASRLEALTTDLLDFVRTGPLDRRPVDPAQVVRVSAEEVAAEGFVLALEGAPERWTMDVARMRQALTNLLRNAHQASADGQRRPRVCVAVDGGQLEVTIRDFGEGLPPGREEQIFDPFFTTRTSGTGLGLAVARRIVELHGGTLTAANHPEGGALFRLTLPAATA